MCIRSILPIHPPPLKSKSWIRILHKLLSHTNNLNHIALHKPFTTSYSLFARCIYTFFIFNVLTLSLMNIRSRSKLLGFRSFYTIYFNVDVEFCFLSYSFLNVFVLKVSIVANIYIFFGNFFSILIEKLYNF